MNLWFQIMQPTLDEMQHAVSKSVQLMLDVSKYVYGWGQTRPTSADMLDRDGVEKLESETSSGIF